MDGLGAVGGINTSSAVAAAANKFLLAAAAGGSVSDLDGIEGVGCGGPTALTTDHLHGAQFDPDTQARLVALLEVAGEALLPHMFLADNEATSQSHHHHHHQASQLVQAEGM